MKIFRLVLSLLLFSGIGFGADQPDFPDIYIDEGCAGTHVGSQANPYDALSEVNWDTGGDNSIFDYLAGSPSQSPTIYLNKGDQWRERWVFGASGTATYPIIITSYGSGDKPIISGADEITTWADQGGNVWKATWASAEQLWFIETDESIVRGVEVANVGALAQEYDWVVDSGEVYCFAASDPDTRYNSVEDSTRQNCIYSRYFDYIHVKDIEIRFGYDHGILPTDAEYWLLYNLTVHWIGETATTTHGIFLNNTLGTTVSNCIVSESAWRGINIYTDNFGDARIEDTIIEYCTVFNNQHTDIELRIAGANGSGTFDGCIIRYNHIYHDSDHDMTKTCNAIYSDNQVTENVIENVEIYYNLIHDIPGYAINPRNGSLNWNIYNNVFGRKLDGFTAVTCHGITIGADSHGGINIKNNIGFDYDGQPLYIADSSLIASCNNNTWYNSVGTVYANVDGTAYHADDFDANEDYKGDTGWDTSPGTVAANWSDAQFVDKANSDFHLSSSSPCIETGADVSLTQDYDGVSVPQGNFPEMGAFEYPANILRIKEILRIRNVLRIK